MSVIVYKSSLPQNCMFLPWPLLIGGPWSCCHALGRLISLISLNKQEKNMSTMVCKRCRVVKISISVFRCLSPFAFKTHISFEKSVWAYFHEILLKSLYSIVLWPNHWGNFFWEKIWIFVEVNLSTEIGFFGLTARVMLL